MPTRKTDSGVRSGRFKSQGTIAVGRLGARYRIFNSGTNDFAVSGGGTTVSATVRKKCSIDVISTGNTVEISGTAEGIYDVIQSGAEIRPGRFRYTKAQAATAQLIMDLSVGGSGAATPKSIYRIYNSGENAFIVQVNNNAVATLDPERSVDIQLESTTTAGPRQVKVIGVPDPMSGAYSPIDGVYEFLGDAT